MTKVLFATGNKGKVASMRNFLEPYNIRVEQKNLDLMEPQFDSVKEIALFKARQAFEALKQPVIVEDSGFCVSALKGFPGPYTKYVFETLTVNHLLKMMDGENNRSSYFDCVLVYIDANGAEHIFEETINAELSLYADDYPLHPEAWSELWRILILDGCTKTLNSLDNKGRQKLMDRRNKSSRFVKFAQWLGTQDVANPPHENTHPIKKRSEAL